MKASELKKESLSVEDIYESIQNHVNINKASYKYIIPHFIYVSDEVKLRLINDGFKLYKGNYGIDEGLIIEW